jgi:hypothetical protein
MIMKERFPLVRRKIGRKKNVLSQSSQYGQSILKALRDYAHLARPQQRASGLNAAPATFSRRRSRFCDPAGGA